jgi:hypothetical protein
MSPSRRFDVNDNFIARAVSGEGADQRQHHVSSDGALEMERRKNARLEARMKELMKALTGVDNGGASKNRTRAKAKEMPAIDKINYSAVYAKIDEDVWSKHPIRPPAWQLYSVHERSMCQIILNCDIALPEGSSAEDYWEAVLKGAVNNKYSFNKSNLIEALKKQYEGGFIS